MSQCGCPPPLSTLVLLSKSLTLIYTNKEIFLHTKIFYFQSKLCVAGVDRTWSPWSLTPVPPPSFPRQNL